MRPRDIHLFITRIVACLVFPGMLVSCDWIYEYDNCPPDMISLSVDPRWNLASEAAPEGMAYVFFPLASDGQWRFDFPGRRGGAVDLPPGQYRMLAFNDDTSAMIFSDDDSFSGISVSCRETSLPDSAAFPTACITPDMMWTDAIDFVELGDKSLTYTAGGDSSTVLSDSLVLPVYPRKAIADYAYIVEKIGNISSARRFAASLSGMAPGIRLADGHRLSGNIANPLGATQGPDSSLVFSWHAFGPPDNPVDPNILCIYVWLTDGTHNVYKFDVTDQVRSAPDPMNVLIRVPGFDLPEVEPVPGGAFDVSVDGWNTIVINIKY